MVSNVSLTRIVVMTCEKRLCWTQMNKFKLFHIFPTRCDSMPSFGTTLETPEIVYCLNLLWWYPWTQAQSVNSLFSTPLWDRNEATVLKVVFTSWLNSRWFFYCINVLQDFYSIFLFLKWSPVPWHRFLYLSGAAVARVPSTWLISFILVASKEARGVRNGASIAARLVQKHRSLSCAVWQPGTRMSEKQFVFRISLYGELQGAGDVWCFIMG